MYLLNYLQAEPAVLLAVVLLLGLLIGSFLNVVITRLPVMMEREWRAECETLLAGDNTGEATDTPERFNLIVPRSRCPSCGHQITALENVPILSYLFLRGRCSDCGTQISIQYPLIEALSGALAFVVAWNYGWGWPLLGVLLFTWALIALAVIDLRTQYLPDVITLPLLWLGLLVSLAGLSHEGRPAFADMRSAIIGAAAGYLSLWLVYHLFRLLTGKEGMGYGDFKLLGALGAWLGWQGLPLTILLSTAVGASLGVILIIAGKRDRQAQIPFGPYLAAAGWVAMLWGQDITRAYLSFSGLG